jgi:hypothetical protein
MRGSEGRLEENIVTVVVHFQEIVLVVVLNAVVVVVAVVRGERKSMVQRKTEVFIYFGCVSVGTTKRDHVKKFFHCVTA